VATLLLPPSLPRLSVNQEGKGREEVQNENPEEGKQREKKKDLKIKIIAG